MPVQPVVVGGTYEWFLNPAMINTETSPCVYGPWNITGATVTITFVSPTGVATSFSATVVNGPKGQAKYVNQTSLLGTVGQWGYSWRVSLSGVVLETQIISFNVFASGAAAAGS